MQWPLILLVQTAPLAMKPATADQFDLRTLASADLGISPQRRSNVCKPRDGEIIVCGFRNRDTSRHRELPPRFDKKPLRAQITILGNVTGTFRVESVEFVPGVKSTRFMITINKPF